MTEKLLSPENEARLRGAITDAGLQIVTEAIIARTVDCAALVTTEPDDYARVGNSRSGGVPDLPDGEAWPQDSEGRYPTFLMQINLNEVPRFIGNLLPERGLLYVFAASGPENMLIRYADADPKALRRVEPPAPDKRTAKHGNLAPYRLEAFSAPNPPCWTSGAYKELIHTLEGIIELEGDVEGQYLEMIEDLHEGNPETWAGKLFGLASHIGHTPDWAGIGGDTPHPGNGGVLLLTLNSDRKTGVVYGDAGYRQIFAEPAAIRAGDFSRLVVRLESS